MSKHINSEDKPSSSFEASGKQAHILIVEDNDLAAIGVKLALKPFHCTTSVAKNGAQAVEKVKNEEVDFILMDMSLPDSSGIDVTKKIRTLSDKKKSQVPIVALTGYARDSKRRQTYLDADILAVLDKPIQPLKLKSLLKTYVFNTRSKASSACETVTLTGKLNVIDWEACVSLCLGDEAFTHQMLSTFSRDLKATQCLLEKAYTNQDMETLWTELHRTCGGICYLKLPELEHSLNAFKKAIEADPQDPTKLISTYSAVQDAMEHFWSTWHEYTTK